MQKGVVTFEDLHEGMMITGKIKNVVDFGAFVDLGIKETALVHISELSDHFVKDPMDAVKVGDVLEFRIISLDLDRRRIGLSRKTQAADQGKGTAVQNRGGGSGETRSASSRPASGAKKRAVVVKKAGDTRSADHASAGRAASGHFDNSRGGGGPSRPARDDDGTMYNPFADALRKMQDQKGKK
jgi:uncharacterized protein